MSRSLTCTTPGTSADYQKYLFDSPCKDDRDGDAILLDFTLAATDASFVRLSRGNYIQFQTNTFGMWYTGYITNEPEYTYLGEQNHVPAWGYRYQASSDEIILSQNALGIFPPFLNQTQGQILQTLANAVQPGLFDFTNVQPGLTLARYVVDPTKKFSDVVSDFCKMAVYRCYAQNYKLYFVPKAGMTTTVIVDGNDKHFTPANLVVKGSANASICNDCLIMGNIEPQRYTTEYFVGDGFTGEFALSSSVFGVESALLLDDAFSGSTFDNSKWIRYDQPVNYIQLFNGYVNVTGGPGDNSYSVHLDSENLLTLGGAMRIAHGEYDFVPQTTDNIVCGVIGGLWTQEPSSAFTGCVYGLRVNKSGGAVTLNPVVNGVVDTTQSQVVQTNGATANVPMWNNTTSYVKGNLVNYLGVVYVCLATTAPGDLPTDSGYWALNVAKRYVLRTLINSPQTYRVSAQYPYVNANGTTGIYGNPAVPATITVTTYITEIDPNTGAVTPGYPNTFTSTIALTASQTYAYYIPVASNDLHVTFTSVTISTPMQAVLSVVEDGPGGFIDKLVGPNEIDATDGLAPYATVAQQGGVNQRQNVLGTPQYDFGSPSLEFFKDTSALTTTVPQLGDIVRLSYRSAGAAMGRSRSQVSVNLEAANWGDSGIRSVVKSNGVIPQPQTSADCEAAAAAIVATNSYTHYEGTYEVVAQNTTGQPVAGSNIQFQNLPAAAFPVSGFIEPMSEIVTHFNATSGGEQFVHNITFGLKGDAQRLLQTLASFQLQSDIFINVDTAQTPLWVPPSSLALAYATEITSAGLDFTNNGTYGSWQASHAYTVGQIILDQNNNLQKVTVAGASGATVPTFGSFINSTAKRGATFTVAQVQIAGGVATITSLTDLTGTVNIGSRISLSALTGCTDLNGKILVVTAVNGLSFTSNVSHADYPLTGDNGTAVVFSTGAMRPTTQDNTVTWQLVGHSYGVDANNIYFRMGTVAAGYEVRYTDDSWGCDPGMNLAGRFSTQTFSLPRNRRNSLVFIQAYDTRNIILSSENWLTSAAMTYSTWTGPTVTRVYGNDPNGESKLLNQVTLGITPLSQTTGAQTFISGTHAVFTVSVKGPAGSSITLGIACATSAHGSSTQSFVLSGQWQRLSVSLTTSAGATEGFVGSLSAVSSVTVIGTWASLEVGTAVETIYCKTQDTLLTGASMPYGANSRYGACVHVGYPLVPPSPTGFVDPTDVQNPIVNLILPAVAQDVWGIEIRASNNKTVLYSANLTDSGYAPAYTYANNTTRSLAFYLYTFNLLGEYSAPFVLNYTIPLPAIGVGNLVNNGGFENGATGWTLFTNGTLSVVNNPAQAHSGSEFLSISGSSLYMDATGPNIAASPGVLYQLTGWINLIACPAGCSASIGVTVYDSSNNVLEYVQNSQAVTGTIGTWQQVQETFTLPANAHHISVFCQANGNGGTITAYFDDISLTQPMYVNDATKTLMWTSANATAYAVDIDTVDFTFAHIAASWTKVIKPTTTATSEALSDADYFSQRYFRVTPFDALGPGSPATLSHVYTPTGVTELDANEICTVLAPSTPSTDPSVPAGVSTASFGASYVKKSWELYRVNTERY